MNVSPASHDPALQINLTRRYQDYTALQTALQNGNVSSAQNAFASFLQEVRATAQKAGPNSLFAPGSQPGKDLDALGEALKAGNLSGAQSAFNLLAQDLQTVWQPANGDPIAVAPPHHHLQLPHHSQFTANSANAASTTAVGKILNLQA